MNIIAQKIQNKIKDTEAKTNTLYVEESGYLTESQIKNEIVKATLNGDTLRMKRFINKLFEFR